MYNSLYVVLEQVKIINSYTTPYRRKGLKRFPIQQFPEKHLRWRAFFSLCVEGVIFFGLAFSF